MDIKGEYRIAAAREAVWAALNDPAMLQACIPGCETLERVSETEVTARILAKVGPVRSTFDTRLELTNLNPPTSYTLVGESKGGAAGFGRGTADVRLEEDGEITVLHYNADFKVGGKLAQVGSRLVLGVTRKTADDFFSTFSTRLDPGAQRVTLPEEAAAAEAGARRRRVIYAVLAAAGVALLAWLLLR